MAGRPSEYRPEYAERAKQMADAGAIDREIADSLRINVATLYKWRNQFPAFRESLKTGKDAADERIVNALYHKANNGDTTAMIFWLKNRRSAEWRDRTEHTGVDGGPIQLISSIPRPPSE